MRMLDVSFKTLMHNQFRALMISQNVPRCTTNDADTSAAKEGVIDFVNSSMLILIIIYVQ